MTRGSIRTVERQGRRKAFWCDRHRRTAWALVNHAGILFQKDLGPDTAKLAERMSSFNPDRTWQKVSDTAPVQ